MMNNASLNHCLFKQTLVVHVGNHESPCCQNIMHTKQLQTEAICRSTPPNPHHHHLFGTCKSTQQVCTHLPKHHAHANVLLAPILSSPYTARSGLAKLRLSSGAGAITRKAHRLARCTHHYASARTSNHISPPLGPLPNSRCRISPSHLCSLQRQCPRARSTDHGRRPRTSGRLMSAGGLPFFPLGCPESFLAIWWNSRRI